MTKLISGDILDAKFCVIYPAYNMAWGVGIMEAIYGIKADLEISVHDCHIRENFYDVVFSGESDKQGLPIIIFDHGDFILLIGNNRGRWVNERYDNLGKALMNINTQIPRN